MEKVLNCYKSWDIAIFETLLEFLLLLFFISFSIWTNSTALICDSLRSALLFCCFFYITYFKFLSLANKIRSIQFFRLEVASAWPLTAREADQFGLTYEDRKVYMVFHSVHPSPFLLGGVWPPTKFWKKRGLERSHFLEWGRVFVFQNLQHLWVHDSNFFFLLTWYTMQIYST